MTENTIVPKNTDIEKLVSSSVLPDPTRPNIVLYHANCLDGFGAAFAAWKFLNKLSQPTYYAPCKYNQELLWDMCKDRNVYFVDFSCKADEMERLLGLAASVTVLDHHKTAFAELKTFFENDLISGVFDMQKSGAILAWNWFHNASAPELLRLIEDRDLWKFKNSQTKEICEALWLEEREFARWNDLIHPDLWVHAKKRLYITGAVLLDHKAEEVSRAVSRMFWELIYVPQLQKPVLIPVTNCAASICSETGHALAKLSDHGIAMTYIDGEKERYYSLRASADGLDVSIIAANYGGGGHKPAAGFVTPRPKLDLNPL